MKGFLNQEQIDYVLYHLNNHLALNKIIRNSLVFTFSKDDIANYSDKIIFILSDKSLDLKEIIYLDQIPVLFTVSKSESSYTRLDGNIVFNHDFLKSAFYLLSGYQEYNCKESDYLGRFPFKSSIQAKLGITSKPIVNYYFIELIKGIEEFCSNHNIDLGKKKINDNFVFSLTHDIDRISYYNLNTFLYSLKLLIFRKKREKDFLNSLQETTRIGLNLINIFRRKDPYWNFKFLSGKDKEVGVNSTYFFLPKDRKHVDSYYNLNERKILDLIASLKEKGNEIGLHGTVSSASSLDSLKKILLDFKSVTSQNSVGIRQHRLMWYHPITARNHNFAGISYDSTLGYADHEGFRNSYCHPFKIFDFENNSVLPYWEIPLNVMDITLLYYRRYSFNAIKESVTGIIQEVKKFNGVFTILWHNSSLHEEATPGITKLYSELIDLILAEKPEILTGLAIIKKYDARENS